MKIRNDIAFLLEVFAKLFSKSEIDRVFTPPVPVAFVLRLIENDLTLRVIR